MGLEISEGSIDLFGQPLVTERGKGRPAHSWTPQNSAKVLLLFACGKKAKDIWPILGITRNTFFKHYFNEVARAGHAPLMMKAEQLHRLNEAAKAGNVAAEKALAGMLQAEQMKAAADRFGDAPRAKPATKGLKQERLEAAYVAGKGDQGWGELLHGETGTPLAN